MEKVKEYCKGGLACASIVKDGPTFKVEIQCESHSTKRIGLNSAQLEALFLALKKVNAAGGFSILEGS